MPDNFWTNTWKLQPQWLVEIECNFIFLLTGVKEIDCKEDFKYLVHTILEIFVHWSMT